MNKKTISTFITRLTVLLCTLGVVLLNTRYLGISGQGTASLISFGILLILALSNFIGGGALIYLIPRMKSGEAVWPSLLCAVISSLLFYLVFLLFPIVPGEFIFHTAVLGLLQSVSIFIQHISLGKERVYHYNLAIIIQAVSGVFFLFVFFFFMHWYSSMAFVTSLYLSFSLALVFITISERGYLLSARFSGLKQTSAKLFRYGKYAQGGNILHLLNQRLNFVFLENMLQKGRLYAGMYSLVLYIAEGIWTVSKSLSLVQYARIANSEDDAEHRALTGKYLRISMLFVAGCCALLIFIPDVLYQQVFGGEIKGLQWAVWWFIPGIMANSLSIIYAHYFSGRGLHWHNAVASALGLVSGIIAALIFIPQMQVAGASLAISVALVVQMLYFFFQYRKKTR